MEALAILFVLGVCAAVVIVPIVALVQALRARGQVRKLNEELQMVQLQLQAMRRQASDMAERVARSEATRSGHAKDLLGTVPQRQENALGPSVPAAAPTEAQPIKLSPAVEPAIPAERLAAEERASVPARAFEPVLAEHPADLRALGTSESSAAAHRDSQDAALKDAPDTQPEASAQAAPPAADASEPAATNAAAPAAEGLNQPPKQFDLEGLIGVRLFAWLGGGALFLAAALFLHYSIQQNLISPPVRVALGLITGALLMAAGDRLRARASMAGQAMAGAGIGTLYAALFAARALYHLLPVTAAFCGMVLVTVAAGALAVKRAAYVIAVLSLVGGVATPFLLSTGQDQPWSLFSYILLLDLGIAWVSKKREWPTLALLGLCASILVFIAWSTHYLYPNRTPYALAAIALVSTLFLSLLWRWRPGSDTEVSTTLRALAHLAMAAPLVVALVLTHLPHLHVSPAFLTGYLVILSAGGALVARRTEARHMPALIAGFAVFAQLGRVDSDLFPAHTVLTLASFSMLPAAHLLIGFYERRTDWQKAHLWATSITLASPLMLATSAAWSQSPSAPNWPFGVYTALHVLTLLGIALLESRPRIYVLAQAVALVVLSLVGEHAGDRILDSWSLWLAVSGLVFWTLPLVNRRLQEGRLPFVASACALPLHFVLLYLPAKTVWKAGPLGSLCVLGGILMLLGIKRLLRMLHGRGDQLGLLALHGGLCLAFLTAALPILLENQWLTVAFGLEVAALGWLHRRVSHRGLVFAAGAIATVTVIRLLFNPSLWDYAPRSSLPILNFYLYTFGIVAASLLLAAHLLSDAPEAKRLHLPACFKWAAVILLFVLVNIEIADFYSAGATLEFRLFGGGLAQDMTYSLAWGLFALALMGLGILRRNRATRMGALLILILTIAKVFLHDLWQLGALYRVGSIVGLAVALLVVSYLVQRFILRGERS